MAKKSRITWVRHIVQILFFVLVALITFNHTLSETGNAIPFIEAASVHAICPFGGVVSIYQYITSGTYTQKIHQSSFILMYIALALTLIAGPLFCGWVCPLGSFQEWIGKIGKKIFRKWYNNLIPKKLDSVLRFLRYVVLVWIILMTAITGILVFSNIDPFAALFGLYSSELAIGGLIVLIIVFQLSFIVERPFCKYACPYGALLGIFNLFRIFKIKRNAATCIDCKKCDKACPMNITISDKAVVRNHQCISCLACTSEQACPVKNTVELAVGKMEVKS
ncbi:MAG: 4Fe-4S binding protein [Spirochaetaceae bacterium]|nr:MAG: 4Fe-4S binding protein [Spirochaetaceae bacterium]